MYKEINITVFPKDSADDGIIKRKIAHFLKIESDEITLWKKLKKSIDARTRNVKVNYRIAVWVNEEPDKENITETHYKDVRNAAEVVIAGAGPAGLFAALRLLERGIKPVILERGKCVEERKKDLRKIYTESKVDNDSNYGFGEGGAGTFSDGKLYTRSKKKGNVKKILEIFYNHGAQENIMWDSHPHIGTDILPKVIINIRNTILKYGGEIHFNTKVSDFIIENNSLKGIILEDGTQKECNHLILATGHSARDVYSKLNERKIALEFKNFAVGVRLEHPQHLIDCIQYHSKQGRGKFLPAAEYSFVGQFSGKGVYSFCMCPGGVVVPAATGDEQQVVNGMSSSGRNTKWANSAMVVEVTEDDLKDYKKYGVLAGMMFQADLEKTAWEKGGRNLYAPAQRMCDFVNNKKSKDLPVSSYKPGTVSSDMHNWMPDFIVDGLQKAFKYFGKRANGFLTNEALMLGVETRTSAPVRIPRQKTTCEHIDIQGIYPCGEGAGYAGGIVSAALDGILCADSAYE